MAFRDIKRRMRRDLHAEMQVPAYYVFEDNGFEPVLLHVRVHLKFDQVGKMTGRQTEWMLTEDKSPEIVFMRDELETQGLTLKRNVVISVEVGEAYTIDRLKAPDDITITAVVNILRPEQTAGLPVPGVV